jgi:hypothetical protein
MKLIKEFKEFLFEAKIQDIRSAITGEKPYSNFFLYPGVIEGILKNDPSVAFTIAGQEIDQKEGPLNKSMVQRMEKYIPLAHIVLDYIEKNYPVSQKDIEEYSGSGLSNSKIHDLLYALSHPDLNILRSRIAVNKRYYWPFEKGDIEILGKWDAYFKKTPYTEDDYKSYLAATSKRSRGEKESLTDQERFSELKHAAAKRRNLIPHEFLVGQVDWDTYFVIFPYTQDDHDLYRAASAKRSREGNESITEPERFSELKNAAARRRNLVPQEFSDYFDWDKILKETPYTQDDHDLYLAALAKRNRGEKESLTEPESFAINKYNAASARKLVPQEFLADRFDWDAYLKENPYTPDDQKRYNSASSKEKREGKESLTDEDRFAKNKYLAYLRRRKSKNKENETN